MTSEGASSTEKWIEAKGAKFPYAYDKGGKVKRFFGIRGIPHAVLIDPMGNVVWRGHPSSLKASTIQQATGSALALPLYDWPDEAKAARKQLAKGKFAKALEEARKLSEPTWAEQIEAQVAARAGVVRQLRDEGDWLALETEGEHWSDLLKGLPEAEEIDAMLETLKRDRDAQEILKVQEKVAKLISGKITERQIPSLRKKLLELSAEHAGTIVERDVDRALAQLGTGKD